MKAEKLKDIERLAIGAFDVGRVPKLENSLLEDEVGLLTLANELIVLAILRDKIERRIAEVRDKITAVSGGRA